MTAGGSGLPVIVEPAQVVTILLGAVLLSFSATLTRRPVRPGSNRPRRCVMNNSSSVVTGAGVAAGAGVVTGASGPPL